jgi:hypothetical protein
MNPFTLKAAEKRAADAMTLEQIRAARARVEAQILNLLQGFKKDTGLTVEDVEVESLTTTNFASPGAEVLITGVRLKLEDL